MVGADPTHHRLTVAVVREGAHTLPEEGTLPTPGTNRLRQASKAQPRLACSRRSRQHGGFVDCAAEPTSAPGPAGTGMRRRLVRTYFRVVAPQECSPHCSVLPCSAATDRSGGGPSGFGENRRMKVQILYFDGCPNWQEAGDRVRAASVAAQLPDLEIEYRRIESDDKAAALPFAG